MILLSWKKLIISCGIRDDKEIYGSRFRVPFEDVYHVI